MKKANEGKGPDEEIKEQIDILKQVYPLIMKAIETLPGVDDKLEMTVCL